MDTPKLPRRWSGPLREALIIENPDPLLDELLLKMNIKPTRIPDAPDEDTLVRLLSEGRYNLLFKRSKVMVTERVIRASPSLAAVMLCCIGHDSVDKQACADHGVLVMNDPVSNGRSVAEMVIGEIICLSRRLFESVAQMAHSEWSKDSRHRFEVKGKRIGILGLGKIGRQVAQLAEAMGMEVCFRDTADLPREVGLAMGWTPAPSIEELFRMSDFVSVHVSSEDHHGRVNRNIITPEHLRAFADKVSDGPRIFLNLARGIVVDPQVLLDAVRAGQVTYAITDVFPEEPGAAATTAWVNPYEGEPRIFATPHIGAATAEAQPRIARYVARTTQLFNEFGMIRNCVFAPREEIDFDASLARAMLAVVHVDKRGTKKAVDDAIFNSGASNIRSAHVDFPKFGIAYDLSALDQPLSERECDALVSEAVSLTGDPTAIRWMRTFELTAEA